MKRILLIEDMKIEAEVIQLLFNQCRSCFHGEVEFQVVGRWGDVSASLEKLDPDVVLCDLTLPDSPQRLTLERLPALASKVPVIVITGDEVHEDELRSQCVGKLGVSDFMMKKEVHRHPHHLCERAYLAYLRRCYVHGSTP